MAMSFALVGAIVAWLLILVLGVGAGYGIVAAWHRHGARRALPTPVQRVAFLLLGPPTGTPHSDRPESGSEDGGAAALAPAEEEDPAVVFTAADAPLAPALPPNAAAAPQANTPAEEPAPEQARPSRSDALEELGVILDAPYEAAKALLASGLWGMENHEEWARTMRGQEPPPGVPGELFMRVVTADPREYGPRLQAYREKRAALQELLSLWGVGIEQAEALYKAGYRDVATIRSASTDKLAKTAGIGHALAFQIRAAAHGLAPAP